MSENNPPTDALFDKVTNKKTVKNSIATESEQKDIEKLKSILPNMMERIQKGPRIKRFLPYLLIRSIPGDNGSRPLADDIVFWESPDVWIAHQDQSNPTGTPTAYGATAIAGVKNIIYAHVWNLGLAPIVGVKVAFYVFDPTFLFQTSKANLIGVTRVDLPPRTTTSCHKLVRCPQPWVPNSTDGHKCIVIQITGMGDPINNFDSWDPRHDRHVAQHNVTVTTVGADIHKLLQFLEMSRKGGMGLQLQQIGSEAATVVNQMAPGHLVDPAVKTHVLAELNQNGRLFLPTNKIVVQDKNRSEHQTEAKTIGPLAVKRIQPSALVDFGKTSTVDRKFGELNAKTGHIDILKSGGDVFSLLDHANLLTSDVAKKIVHLPPPRSNQAQVLRLISYDGTKITGGYTIIIKGDT